MCQKIRELYSTSLVTEGKQYFAFLHVFPCSSETVEVSCYIGHAVFHDHLIRTWVDCL